MQSKSIEPCRVVAIAACAAALALPLHAEPVLQGKDLNEGRLIDALTPPPAVLAPAADAPAAADDEMQVQGEGTRLRSIRVRRDTPSAQAVERIAAAPPPKTSASLLITFVTNSAELTERARASLDIVGRALQSDRLAAFRFAIEGHADPRGNHDDNLRLSQQRAESVVAYLEQQHRIARERLQPLGKGDSELMNTQRPDAPENRRVTIVTLKP